ncbi:hypothetical protein Enr13x_33650 [Stieleria neptunia]|uniref:Transmembrane protein n=1 Tax=Stieleria neptunia TaxID=2527979 RepID=A0A518HRU7_9BACT|nr:hypothetical protein [Stieleria neptunia]QDV43508.1 hypothetical protein Enr13x_33650 [Stieleria neptunia]
MGETIRYLMVAIAALISILQIAPARLVAQAPSGGFEIPPSLSGAFGSSESSAQPSRGGGSASMGLPNFTGGVDTQRVGPRAGGPTTDPMASRDRNWLAGMANSGGNRPTTDPVGGNALGSPSSATRPSATLRNDLRSSDLRSSQNPNAIATVGATQDPQSREAQLMANAREATASPTSAGSGASRGFGGLPSGVRLPDQGNAAGSSATFGSEFARNTAAASPNTPDRPVYGPPTAQEANYDLSVFNRNNNARSNASASQVANSQNFNSQNVGQNPARTTAQQDLLFPGSLSGGAASRQAATGGSALGFPAADPRATDPRAADPRAADPRTADPRAAAPSVPSSWTYEQIAQLGQLFGIQPTDPRMGDKNFVNDLYVSYREYLAKQQAAQATTETMANAATPGRWSAGEVGTGGQAGWNLPGVQPPAGPSQPNTLGGLPVTDPRFASLDGATNAAATGAWGSEAAGSRRPDVDPRLSQKDIDGLPPGAWSYDKYGNPIDKERYVLDRFGERVDEETQWELTIGRKRRMEEERLAKLEAERGRTTLSTDSLSGLASASDRLLAGDGVPAAGSSRPPAGDVSTAANRPNLAGAGGGIGQGGPGPGNRVPPTDQAGIAGAAGAIGRSNPYVNVFLLCSLVANAFLFISLHRLWYHHRDLIASSRMAASGMSNND